MLHSVACCPPSFPLEWDRLAGVGAPGPPGAGAAGPGTQGGLRPHCSPVLSGCSSGPHPSLVLTTLPASGGPCPAGGAPGSFPLIHMGGSPCGEQEHRLCSQIELALPGHSFISQMFTERVHGPSTAHGIEVDTEPNKTDVVPPLPYRVCVMIRRHKKQGHK